MSVKEKAEAAIKDLIELSAISIGMSNYKEILRRYQQMLLDALRMIRDLDEKEK
jgi:hypothetical protein